MKVKQVKDKLILTWEKDDEIKVGETITIDLRDREEIEMDRYKKISGIKKPVWYWSWYFKHISWSWRFYFGKVGGYWTLNIGTPLFDCGRAW